MDWILRYIKTTFTFITGCLKPTNTNSLPVPAGIGPSDIRRAVASRMERTRQTTDEMYPLNGHLGVAPRLKSRRSFIRCNEPINTTAKAARSRGVMERTTRAPVCQCAPSSVLTNTFQLAQRIPGQPGRHSTGCVHRLAGQE